METTVRPFGGRDKIGSADGDKVFLFDRKTEARIRFGTQG